MKNTLFIILQYIVPQHWLSRLAGKVAECRWPWLKNNFITWFIKRYDVDMSEAADPEPFNYESFNAFFTRELKADARSIVNEENTIACPADGAISQMGDIEEGRIFQAKGQHFDLVELLGGNTNTARAFKNGKFATIYLSPKDYHRAHMPLKGKLKNMTYIPGDLFSVNGTTAENVPRLFARNERASCIFETDAGPMAVVLVGAMIVAGIETTWAGQVTPLKRKVHTHNYLSKQKTITIEKGEEMGRFKLGSTVIVLFGKDSVNWNKELAADASVRMGALLGNLTTND